VRKILLSLDVAERNCCVIRGDSAFCVLALLMEPRSPLRVFMTVSVQMKPLVYSHTAVPSPDREIPSSDAVPDSIS